MGPFLPGLVPVAMRIAMPVVGALLLTDLAMGLVARMVPQMNVLVVGFPIKVGVGVLVLAVSVPLLAGFMSAVFRSSLPDVQGFLVP